MSFKYTKIIGQKAEEQVKLLFERAGCTCEIAKTGEKFYDLKADYGLQSVFVEIKNDLMCDKTHNLAIEFYNPKKDEPSGLMITLSDYWCICLGNPLQVWISEVERLKDYTKENKPFRIVDVGGDRNSSMMLYKKDKLLEDAFIRIDNMDSSELESCIKFYVASRAKKYYESDEILNSAK